ncbi:formate/nitrite transporter family protein [Microbacterium sp. SS28]|uniref:formate/nitrite transporter family protein n=1 Tax=Microbacterium sp. SS28 TaxID=2919948 RepID=UPI001FA9DC23|nr:formate/nitrite transporter family protein [Microbacterium sp. SS28]
MRTIEDTLRTVQVDAARHKVHGLHEPARFAISGMLAGAYVGIAVVLMLSTAGPLAEAGSGFAKLVSGLVFGVALTFVVFAGAELVTSSMMTLTQGAAMRAVRPVPALGAMGFTLAANFVGSVIFGVLVAMTGVLHSYPAAGRMLAGMLEAKAGEDPLELFTRGILCNVLVCLGIWMCARLTSDVAKIMVIFCAILAFISSGFEHVVANMTTYTMGLVLGDPNATWALFSGNVLWVGLGNLVGGAVVVGLGYWAVAGSPRVAVERAVAAIPSAVTGIPPMPARAATTEISVGTTTIAVGYN